jgi:hypothetical protein
MIGWPLSVIAPRCGTAAGLIMTNRANGARVSAERDTPETHVIFLC